MHAGLARVHEALGHPRLAARHYREALRLRPGWSSVESELARLLAERSASPPVAR